MDGVGMGLGLGQLYSPPLYVEFCMLLAYIGGQSQRFICFKMREKEDLDSLSGQCGNE